MLFPEINPGHVKDWIIRELGHNFPLSAREIFYAIKKQGASYSYQAVFKALQELTNERVIEKDNMKYLISKMWMVNIYDFAERLRTRFLQRDKLMLSDNDTATAYFFDPRILNFVESVGQKVLEYYEKKDFSIIALGGVRFPGGARYYALALKQYLLTQGKSPQYGEVDRETLNFYPTLLKSKNILIVDSAVYTGTTYRRVIAKLDCLKEKCKVTDIRYAVGYDMLGVADWSCNKLKNIKI